jgi:GNAT superfamily N-acetyltransferase
MVWRATREEVKAAPRGSDRKPLMKSRVMDGTTDTYRDLGGPEAETGEKIWSLACMYIHRKLRGEGYGIELIEAAKAYAKKRGGTVLEAYPVDPKSPSYRFMGFVPAFKRLGFEKIGKAGTRRHVMRLTL